jgi:hypothetical protein
MKPIIYPIAVLAGLYATINTYSLVLSDQKATPLKLISKAKYEILIDHQTKSQWQILCPTELKIHKELKQDKDLIKTLLNTFA